jgi:dTDP-4-dehydrorhamnose 3,5-epimerase-like enzyme
MEIKTLDFDIKGDSLGYLIALESHKNTPFPFKRVYYIFDIDVNDVRGKHAHKKLEQILICCRGKCKVMFDDKREKRTVELDRPNKAVVIPPMVWHEMFDFSPDCLLIAAASDFYDERDYIRSYDEFLRLAP